MILIAAFLIASIASLVSGFFGSGSGLISIPLLSRLLYLSNIPKIDNMHVVIGTVFAFTLALTTVTTITHHKHNNINWKVFYRLLLPTTIGVISGSIYAHDLNNHYLHIFFGSFVLCLAIWNSIPKKLDDTNLNPKMIHFPIIGFLVAFTVGMTSMGVFMVPFLRKYKIPLISAIATTQALGVLTSLIGMLSYIVMGISNKTLPSSCIGYVNWQLLLPLIIGSMIFARIGVKLSLRTSPQSLNILFNIFLIVVGIEMLITA